MNFVKINFGTLALGAVAGIAALSAPAHAVSIGSDITFSWIGDLDATEADFGVIPGTGTNDNGFGDFIISSGAGDFSSLTPTNPSRLFSLGLIKDLSKIPVSGAGVADFITFDDDKVGFSLTSLAYVNNNPIEGYTGRGLFRDGTPGLVTFSTQFGDTTNSYSGNLAAVPTPALLPGLIGMGVAALRRRKSDEEGSEKA